MQVTVNDKLRIIRQLNREDNPDIEEIFRRYQTDKIDFEEAEFMPDFIFNDNSEEDFQQSLDMLVAKMRAWAEMNNILI